MKLNMNKVISAFLSTALAISTATAGPIVNKMGKNPFNTLIAAGIEKAIGVPSINPKVAFYETFPISSMISLNDVNQVPRSDDPDSVVLTDYIALNKQSDTGSALGLRMALAPMESRLKASQSMAESGLIKTGDIIVSTRPMFANSLQYLALQLLATHISTAVVVTENGKKVVYNIDMPMDADMLGGAAVGFGKSVFDSPHFTGDNDNLMLHVLRPRLDDNQRTNLQKWYELALSQARAKTMYPASVSFNTDYNSPTYRETSDLSFVGDIARLLLGKKMLANQHMQMFCSEFAWTMLTLRDCNPNDASFSNTKQPSCIKEFFKPMLMFGSAFSIGKASDQDLFGMTDGIPTLINATGADPQTSKRLIDFALPGVEKEAKGLSNGHKSVAAEMKDLISNTNKYFSVLLTKDNQMIEGFRSQLNPVSPRNYSPTGFVVQAAMPDMFNGQKVTQKKLDYVATIKYVPKALIKDLQSK